SRPPSSSGIQRMNASIERLILLPGSNSPSCYSVGQTFLSAIGRGIPRPMILRSNVRADEYIVPRQTRMSAPPYQKQALHPATLVENNSTKPLDLRSLEYPTFP